MVEALNLEIGFENSRLLIRKLNFRVSPGETLVIVGRSGNGKTTLLKTLAGLIAPRGGKYFLFGKNVEDLSFQDKSKVLNQVGMLFQKNALFDSLTIEENLSFPLRESGLKNKSDISERVEKSLSEVDLLEFKHLYPEQISGGMQKRLGIARALILQPKLILYDDPTAGLDPITSRLIVKLILSSKRRLNSTLIVITNEMQRAYQMADRIGLVLDEQLIIAGNVEQTLGHVDPRVSHFIRGENDPKKVFERGGDAI